MNLLGLRGQAKTRIARQMTALLDEYIPIITGSELNDDPLNPISAYAKQTIEEHGDLTKISCKCTAVNVMLRSPGYTGCFNC